MQWTRRVPRSCRVVGPGRARRRTGRGAALAMKAKRNKSKTSHTKEALTEIQPAIAEKQPEGTAIEIEELQMQLDKIQFEGETIDIFRTEWTVEEDMFILKHFEVRKISAKKCEKLYESAQISQPKSFTKNISHEDLTKRYEDLKAPELSRRRELLLRIVRSHCKAEDEEADAEAEIRRQADEEGKAAAVTPVQRPRRSSRADALPEEDMVNVLVLDEIRCPTRVVAGRRALRSSPVLRGMLASAPPPRPPDNRPEIILDAAADGFADLRAYGIVQVHHKRCTLEEMSKL